MEQTIKLYDADSHLYDFDASVISCEKTDKGFAIVLDKTAFFPEGGGQPADEGTLNGIAVTDVQIKDGVITHTTAVEIPAGSAVKGAVDSEIRFRRMQNHSGEHIVSGLIHKLFGYNNVGFHMGSEDVTLDLDGVLTREDLDKIEMLANRAVYENVNVRAEYPSPEILKDLDYRSKLDLTENVRIVTIEGYDVCACCAPHVNKTGEIGIIKLLDFLKYKGGVRIHMLCGFDALEDYNRRYKNVAAISAKLSAKQAEVYEAVERLSAELSAEKQAAGELKRQLVAMKIAALEPTDGNMVLVEKDMDMLNLRNLVNEAVQLCGGICAAFSGSDENGYNYIIARGGGKDEMIQGSAKASEAEIRAYFLNN